MQNKLIDWLEEKRGDTSIRQMATQLDLSHSHLAKVLKGEKPITWDFCATVAEKMNLDYVEAFTLAGLLPTKSQPEKQQV